MIDTAKRAAPSTTPSPLARPTGEFPRRFVPKDADLGDWTRIAPLFDELERRAIASAADLEKLVLDYSELVSALSDERARRSIATSRDTEDAALERAFLEFVKEIEPKASERGDAISRKIASDPSAKALPERYAVYLRNTRNQIEIFRAENLPIEAEVEELAQAYGKITGSWSVLFRGEEKTLTQLALAFQEKDRLLRQEAFEAAAGRRLRNRDAIDDIYDAMIAKRTAMARSAGFPSFVEYRFRQLNRFDYTPADCEKLHAAVEKVAVPLQREMREERRKALALDKLRPWDLDVDTRGLPGLRPFTEVARLVSGAGEIFSRLDPELAAQFRLLDEKGMLDLENRKKKRPGGYCYTLDESRIPFIFANAVGVDDDVRTLLHECGHAFHSLACRNEPLVFYRDAPTEFAEVASMSMELLGAPHMTAYYGEADCARSRREALEDIVRTFTWVATIDAFQHWIYRHPGHTRAERKAAWLALADRFSDSLDWSGYEEVRASAWQRQLHLFFHPLYYVEYAIAQIGALQVWLRARENAPKALADYRKGLSLGGSKPLPQLFEGAGVRFDFGEAMLEKLLGAVRDEWRSLGH